MKNLKKYSFITFGLLPLLISFVFTRLPYFLFYPIVGFGKDTYSYYLPIKTLLNGNLPLFDHRTPGYTIFLGLMELLGSSSLGLILVQCLFSFLSILFLFRIIHKNFNTIVFALSCFAMLLFYSSADMLKFDTTVLTEGLYTHVLIVTIALFINAVFSVKKIPLILLSFSVAALVLIRPQGLFFVPILFAYSVYMWFSVRSLKLSALPIIPFGTIVLLFFTYNFFTFGSFSFSAFGAVNKLGTEVTYMKESKDYRPEVNKIINRIQNNFPEKYVDIVRNSWSHNDLVQGFSVHDSSLRMMYEIKQTLNLSYFETSKILDRIAQDASKGNSMLYFKFCLTSFIGYHLNFTEERHFYFNDLISRCGFYANGSLRNYRDDESVGYNFKEYAKYIDGELLVPGCKKIMADNYISNSFHDESVLLRLSHYLSIAINIVFRNPIWIMLFAIAYLISIVKLLQSKFKNKNAFVIFMIGNTLLLSSILVAMVQLPYNRYSAPTEFVYYLSVALLPSLFLKEDE